MVADGEKGWEPGKGLACGGSGTFPVINRSARMYFPPKASRCTGARDILQDGNPASHLQNGFLRNSRFLRRARPGETTRYLGFISRMADGWIRSLR